MLSIVPLCTVDAFGVPVCSEPQVVLFCCSTSQHVGNCMKLWKSGSVALVRTLSANAYRVTRSLVLHLSMPSALANAVLHLCPRHIEEPVCAFDGSLHLAAPSPLFCNFAQH